MLIHHDWAVCSPAAHKLMDACEPCMRGSTGTGNGRGSTALGSSILTRTKRTHPMASFKPTRGHALIVFNDMDKDKNGKVRHLPEHRTNN